MMFHTDEGGVFADEHCRGCHSLNTPRRLTFCSLADRYYRSSPLFHFLKNRLFFPPLQVQQKAFKS